MSVTIFDSEKRRPEVTDEMVLRAARTLRWLGFDRGLDIDEEPSLGLRRAVRVALAAAGGHVPHRYVEDGPA